MIAFKILITLIGIYIGFYLFSIFGAIIALLILINFLFLKPSHWSSKYNADMTWRDYDKVQNMPKNRYRENSDCYDTFDSGGDSGGGGD